jgi:hypothetical protein
MHDEFYTNSVKIMAASSTLAPISEKSAAYHKPSVLSLVFSHYDLGKRSSYYIKVLDYLLIY